MGDGSDESGEGQLDARDDVVGGGDVGGSGLGLQQIAEGEIARVNLSGPLAAAAAAQVVAVAADVVDAEC